MPPPHPTSPATATIMRPCIVEFVGRAASGKSTICRKAAEMLLERGLEVVFEPLPQRISAWSIIARPKLAWAASRLGRLMQGEFNGRYPGSYWIRRLHRLDAFYRQPADVVLSDQGVLQTLRKSACLPRAATLAALPLPHVVAHISAPLDQVNRRLVEREESDLLKGAGVSGVRRRRWAVRRAAILLPERGAAGTTRFLRQWGERCSPPLTDVEVAEIISEAARLDPALAQKPDGTIRLRPLLEERGVHWITIENPDGRNPEDAAAEVLAHCLGLLDAERLLPVAAAPASAASRSVRLSASPSSPGRPA